MPNQALAPAQLQQAIRAANNNGQLVCESQGECGQQPLGWFVPAVLPRNYGERVRDTHGHLPDEERHLAAHQPRTRANCNDRRANNDDGQLVCESQGASNNRWEGSFQRSCRDISMDASGTLTATCQTISGTWQRTSLGARQCSSYRAGNSNGQLVCEK